MGRSSSVLLLAAAITVMLVHGAMALDLGAIGGGPLGWGFPRYAKFYQDCADGFLPIHGGDIINFDYGAGENVLLVNQDDCSTCNTQHPIAAWTNGPHGLALQARNIYRFISGAPAIALLVKSS